MADACADPYALQKLTLKGRLSEATTAGEQHGGGGPAKGPSQTTAAAAMPYRRATVRPVALKRSGPALQVSLLTARQDLTRNYAPGPEARDAVRALLDLPWRSAALTLADGLGGLDVQVSREEGGREEVVARRRRRPSSAAQSPPSPAAPLVLPSHDRRKALPLPPDEPDPFLQRLGLQGADGRARADGRRKLAQVNALLRLMDATGAMEGGGNSGEEEDGDGEEVHVLDAGCGASVLTFGVYRHLQKKQRAARGGRPRVVRLTGVDTNAALMRRSAEAARELLDPSDPPAAFLAMPIRDYGRAARGEKAAAAAPPPAPPPPTPPPDLVLALHACDAATDEALALAVRTRARLALAVPCCMVSMHRGYAAAVKGARRGGEEAAAGGGGDGVGGEGALEAAVARATATSSAAKRRRAGAGGAPPPPAEAPLAALLRHGILKQRLLDLATDALRAALLRCFAGCQADAVEFVSTEHTPRNLLLRAALPRAGVREARQRRARGLEPLPLPLDPAAVREYRAMRAFLGGAAPALESLLERDGQLPPGWLLLEEEGRGGDGGGGA